MQGMHNTSSNKAWRIAAAGAGLVAVSATLAFADARIGVNAAVRNYVQTKSASEPALHPAAVRASVYLGDAVVSGDDSALQILLVDRSVFTVGANARMTIDRFVFDPDRGASDVAASVARGAFRFMSGPSLGGGGRNAISSPVATIGVRGTIVEGVVGPDALKVLAGQPGLAPQGGNTDSATLVVLRGPGRKSMGFDKPGAIDVSAGGVTIPVEHPSDAVVVWGPGQRPVGPFTLSDAGSERLSALLRTNASSGGTKSANALGDVGSAGANSGDLLDPGSLADPFTAGRNAVDLPMQQCHNPVGKECP
jgi:hypothetical protein